MAIYRQLAVRKLSRLSHTLALTAATALFALPLRAVEVEQITLEVENSIGIPAIQAIISSCLGELVLLTGTVHIVTVDGVATYFNWQGMAGRTLDGDVFVGGSGVSTQQSNLTLAEVGAGREGRLVHLQIVDGQLAVTCKA